MGNILPFAGGIFPNMDSIDWACGIFEGEGCVVFHRQAHRGGRRDGTPRSSWPQMKVKMSDRDVIERFHRTVGVGCVTGPHRSKIEGRKSLWEWVAGGEEAQSVGQLFLPMLGERRSEKVRELLAWTRTQAKVAPCGTESGRMRHYKLGEPACDLCKEARRGRRAA